MQNGKSKMQNGKTKKSLKQDERAVSPVIGVIMMIAIVVIIAAVVAAFAYGIIGGVKKAPSAALIIEGAVSNSEKITLIHHGGDTLIDAFDEGDVAKINGSWMNIEVRRKGAPCILTYSELNGELDWGPGSGNTLPFEAGDELKLIFNGTAGTVSEPLETGDSIVILYTPTDDILQRTTVT